MNSIRSRLTVTLLTGVFLLLLIAGVVLLYVIRGRFVAEFDRGLESKARTLVAVTSLEEHLIEIEFDEELMPQFDGEDGEDPEGEDDEEEEDEGEDDDEDEDEEDLEREYFVFYLHNGSLIGQSPSLSAPDRLPADVGREDSRLIRNVELPDGRDGRSIQIRFAPKIEVPDPDETGPSEPDPGEIVYRLPESMTDDEARIVLVVAVGRERLDSLLAALNWTVGLVIGLLLAFIGPLVWILMRRGFQPLHDLNEQMGAIGPDSLDERVNLPDAADELTGIVTTLNGLLDRVETGFLRERRFSSDVAHELRTPVAELITACEVGGKWPEEPAACRQLFNDIKDVAEQMRIVVETLLELSRCDNGTATIEKSAIALRSLVDECWVHTNGKAEQKGVALENKIGAEHIVESDEQKLRMIVQNLIDNAVAHGTGQGVVTCRASCDNGTVNLFLCNEADTLEKSDVPRMFDRFWQGDAARSATNRFGLGLPIVKALAGTLDHPLEARLENSVFEVHLGFPAAKRGI